MDLPSTRQIFQYLQSILKPCTKYLIVESHNRQVFYHLLIPCLRILAFVDRFVFHLYYIFCILFTLLYY